MNAREPFGTMDAFHHRNLPHLLLHVREALMAHFRPVLNEAGVTEQQWRVLRVLSEEGPLEPNQIARSCQILSPSLTRMLAGMEAGGLIHRERLDADQRRQTISLTTKSQALIERMRPVVDQRYRQLEATIGRELLERLYRDLDQAADLVKRAPAATPTEDTDSAGY